MIEQPDLSPTRGTIDTPLGTVSVYVEARPNWDGRHGDAERADWFRRTVYVSMRVPYLNQPGKKAYDVRFDLSLDYDDRSVYLRGSTAGSAVERTLGGAWRPFRLSLEEVVVPLVRAWVGAHPEAVRQAELVACWREAANKRERAASLRRQAADADADADLWEARFAAVEAEPVWGS